jgi:septum formation protein
MGLWLGAQPLVLASASASRRSLLEAAGIPLEIVPAALDERGIEARREPGGPAAAAELLARAKARTVAARMPGRLVLGADQTLALGTRRFSKPDDRAAAREQLRTLRGKTHTLYSAVAVARGPDIVFEHAATADLTMRALSDAFIEAYLDQAGAAATQSVGGYQVEGAGIHLFERIAGDHATILGLPLIPVLSFLRREGCLAA